jgi:hypothetical protein
MHAPHSLPRARSLHPLLLAAAATGAALVLLAASCGPKNDQTLSALCERREAVQRIDASVDTILPHAGTGLAAVRGRHFALRLTFTPAPVTGPAAGTAECEGVIGEARFSGDLPLPLRNAAASNDTAGWRIDGDTVLVDLNPRARDNNLVMSVPLRGGGGHWALSTFAGEVVRGRLTTAR